MNPQNWNLYSYVRGNPVNYNDPTGHQGEKLAKLGPPQGTVWEALGSGIAVDESGIGGLSGVAHYDGPPAKGADTAPTPGAPNFIGPVKPATGTKITDAFSIIDKVGNTLGVTGPPGPPDANGGTNDTGTLATAISKKLEGEGTKVNPTTESKIMAGDFGGGDKTTNLIWVSHSSGNALVSNIYGGPGISAADMAHAISNGYFNKQLSGNLNVLFVGCNTAVFAREVYNQIAPQYRSLVTIVGSRGAVEWRVSKEGFLLQIEAKGGWIKFQ